MAGKGKPSKNDLLDSLFDKKKEPGRGKSTRGGPLHRTSATDNIFSMLAEEIKKNGGDTEDSDVSAADPDEILKNMKDIDDMDADLFTSKKKPSSAPAPTKLSDETAIGGRKPNSAPPSSARNYKKFSFPDSHGAEGQTPSTKDLDDPPADLLDDLLPDETKSKASVQQTKPDRPAASPSLSPIFKKEISKAAKKRGELTFEDDQDDLMDALGFDTDKNNSKKKENVLWSNRERGEQPQKARTRLGEILESLTSPRHLERPPTGERKEQPQSQDKKPQEKKETLFDDDLTFGSYQPTLGSNPEGRQPRRQSVRFSTEDVRASTPETKPKPVTPTRSRNSADWLGLKTNDEPSYPIDDAEEKKTSTDSPKVPSSPLLERKSSLTGSHATSAAKPESDTTAAPTENIAKQPEVSKSHKKEEEEDWLAGALSRKKTLPVSEVKSSKQEQTVVLGEEISQPSSVREAAPRPPRRRDDTLPSFRETSTQPPSTNTHATPVSDERTKPALPPENPKQNTSAAGQQVTFSADSLQQLLLQQQMMQSQFLGFGGVVDSGAMQRLQVTEQQLGDHQALQARIIQLEGQVKTLQLEKDQSQMLLENLQQRHKQDLELVENAHKARVKLLEESAAQRETRMLQECEDLMERLATVTQASEQERSELQVQYQRKLAQAQQDRDREVERLRDLQRKSILEMKKDHEDQVQRLKRLKEEEIDAVTSATSQTRSLTLVIEQMDQFSSRLGELSSRIESTHEHTAHGLEQGARHRDEQLRIMQERLAQQQKAMAEERAYLKEIISRMDSQINEQQRQLEKERWRVTAEQAKAESTLRSLEEERRSLSMQTSMEREELERAKSLLLEEQKSVMQHCAEERRKLAAEWSHFHAQEKQRHERAEREVSSLLEKREGSIVTLAQEQADLKLRTAELKQKETALAQERDTLERLREELHREKERISSTALRLKTRAQEVEAFSKLAADKYEEGEQALVEAHRVEAEHSARLKNVHSQTERLRQQEQRILQERIRLNHLQKETEQFKPDPPSTSAPQVFPPRLPDLETPHPTLAPTLDVPTPTVCTNSQSMALQASLALWKYTAEKDREYLQEEQIFLDNLKKKSYRSFNTD